MSLSSWVNKAWSASDWWDKDENKKQKQQFAQQAQQQQQARQPQQPGQPRQVNQQQQLPTAGTPRRTNVTDVISTLNTPKPQIAPPVQPAPPTLQQQVNKSYGSGISGIGNRLRDVVDPNTQADNIRRTARSGLNENFDQQQQRLTQQAINTKSTANSANQFSGAGLKNIVDRVGKAPGSIAQLQGRNAKAINKIDNPFLRTGAKLVAAPFGGLMSNSQADKNLSFGKNINSIVDNKLQQSSLGDRQGHNKWVRGAGQVTTDLPLQLATGGLGLVNIGAQTASDEANKAQAAGRSNESALGIGYLQGGASALSEKIGIDRFLPGKSNVTGNTLVKALKSVLTEGAQEGQQQFTQNLIANKTYDPNQSLKEGVLESVVLGGLAGGGTSLALDTPNIANKLRQSNQTQQAPTKTGLPHTGEVAILSDYQESLLGKLPLSLTNQTHAAARNIAQQYGLDVTSGSPYEINNRINNFIENGIPQAPKPPSFFNRAKDRLKLQNDGGYIAGPLALDFSKAKADGKVFDGVDGKPRFEVDDSGAKIKNPEGRTLGEVLDHPQLFKNYPELASMPVDTKNMAELAGGYMPKSKRIALDAPDKGTVLHETQHAIQDIEGADMSYAPSVYKYGDAVKILKSHETVGKELLKMADAKKQIDAMPGKRTVAERKKIVQLDKALQKKIETYKRLDAGLKDAQNTVNNYNNSSIEAEARAVQSRMNMPMSERYVPNENLGQKEAYTPEYNQMAERNRLAAEPFDYDLMRTHFNVNPEVKGNKVKVYRLTDAKTGELLPGDNVSYAPVKDVDYITAAKMGITKIINDPKYKQIEQWIPKKDLYQTPAGTQIYAPNGLKTSAKRSTFYDSLDVPKKDLIIRNDGGKAMYAKPKTNRGNFNEQVVNPQGAIPAPVKPDTAYSDMQRGLNAQEQAKGTKNSSPRSQSLKEALQQTQQTEGRLSTSQGGGDTSKSSNSQLDQKIQRRKEQIKNREQNTSNTNVPQTLNEFDKAIGGTGDIEAQIQDKSVTQRANSAGTKKLMEAISQDDIITKAAAEAQQSGKEINFYAEKDANGRSVGIKRFDPRSNMIQSGFVTDKNGNTLGNHIKVDPTGLQVNVGGEMVNIGSMLGDVTKLGNNFKISSTMERNIRDNAPKEVADKLYKYTVANKIQNESNFKTELANERASLRERTKQTMKAKPRGVSHTDYKADIFDYIEGNKSQTDLMGKYNTAELKTIDNYAKSTRNLYDSLLSRANTEFEKYGLPTVMPRKDYITHINELMNKQSFVGEVAGQLQGGIADEGKQTTRGAVPGNIAGRTEGFKPSKQWNRFFQERKGGAFSKDPFKAVDAYLEPTLHNIHMTESGVRARAVESALRTASELKEMNTTKVASELSDSLAKFKAQGGNNELVRGFQEYANAITGKTQAFDRQIIDSGKGPALALKGWQKLQKIGGQATILGNVNSVLMQPLNQVGTLAQGGVKNYLKGTVASITGNKAIDSSPFITARQAKTDKVFKSKGQKVMDTGAVPLEILEMASVKNAWNVMHEQVKSEGIKGQDAIIETDRRTERLVAGRGIADRPELYRSTAANGVLQYTLEVNAQNKQFWHDLSPKQKATFMIATTGVNSILGAVTGNAPLPDFLKALYDSVMDFADGEDDDSVLANAGQTAQRLAGEAASMNPLVSAGANLLPKGVRQGMFGKESDLGRYDGTAAPVQVVKNAYDTVSNLAKGEFDKAANSALRTVPFGNQSRKTKAGYQLLASGDVEVNPWNATRALAFGPNAIKDKPEYGSSNRISSSKGAVNASSVANKGSNSLGKAGDVDSILKGQFNTKEGKQFLAMKEADKKAAAESDPEMKKMYDQYKTTKRINAANPDRPDGLSKESANVLNWDKKRTVAQKEKLKYSQNDYDYKLTKAKYEQEKLNGTLSRAEEINKKQLLKKAEIGSKFSKDTRESYDSLSKQELLDLVANNPDGKAMYEKALAYGDALVKAGLTKKNKLRTGGSGGGKGKGGGGKKGNSAAGVSSLLAMMKAGAAIKPPTTPKAPAIQAKKPTAVKLKKYAGAKSGKVSAPKISSRKGIKYA